MGKFPKKEVHVPYKAKVLELFGGIGASRIALDNLFSDCKIKSVDYVDVLNWAVEAYKRIAPTCYLPQSVVKWNMDVDILIHGSPCQDFSMAGKGKGGEEGTGTRSSLLWQTIDIIKNRLTEKPSVVIWENVKGVLNKNHKHVFNNYLESMEKLGYKNQWKILNGVDYGIPQRRERVFVVSILPSDERYNHFDIDNLAKTPTRPLKEFLEDTKDLQYYIKQPSMIKAIERGKIKIVDNVVSTITTKQMRWNNAGVVKVPLTTFNAENYVFNTEQATLPTITAGGANSRLKIAIPLIETRGKGDFVFWRRVKDGEFVNGNYNRVWKENKNIGTVNGMNPPKTAIPLKIKNKAYEVLLDKDNKPLPVFIIDDKPYHLRIITPREAWRLMGFRDEHYNKIEDLPKTAKYHLAGNSMIVQVMEAIFSQLLWRDPKLTKPKGQISLFDI